MRWYSLVAFYFLFWAFSVFFVLPFGVKTTDEAGGERVPGQAESAPHEFRIWRTVIRVTIVATVAFAIFLVNYHYGWVTPHSLDFSGRLDEAASQ